MPPPFIDIKFLGAKQLERDLAKLPAKVQKTTVARALTRSANRIKTNLLLNLSGRVVQERTGALIGAFESMKIKARSGKTFVLRGIPMPRREALGIDPKDPYYYPFAIEYGHAAGGRGGRKRITLDIRAGQTIGITRMVSKHPPKDVPARPFMRKAVDDNRQRELRLIARDVGKGIERQWRKMGKVKA